MNLLFRFLARYHTLLLFLLLLGVSVVLIANTTGYQQNQLMGVAHSARVHVHEGIGGITGYLSLKEENERLQEENRQLRNQLNPYLTADTLTSFRSYDSIKKINFNYLSARIVTMSTNKVKNLFAVNVGLEQGVKPDMGVTTSGGIVGVVTKVSNGYAMVMPVINRDFHTSSRLVRSHCEGMLSWDGVSYREALLSDVPQHIDVRQGDTIVTSGNSLIFPPGVMVGTVKSFEVKKGNLYEIRVTLSVDYKQLQDVYIIQSEDRVELDSLMNGKTK